MTIWIDDHLDPELAAWLGSRYKVIAKTLPEIGLEGADDDVLYDAAKRFDQIVMLTKDYDIVELVERPGCPAASHLASVPQHANPPPQRHPVQDIQSRTGKDS